MAATANERLFDAEIVRAIDLQRFGAGAARRILALLRDADADLAARLAEALERLGPDRFTTKRLEAIAASLGTAVDRAYNKIGEALTAEMAGLAGVEAGFQAQLFASVLPVNVGFASITAEQAFAAVTSRPMRGRLLRDWAGALARDKRERVAEAIKIGFVENETVAQMVRRIRGTRAANYTDGVLAIDRRNAAAVVRTAVAHTAQFARQRFYEENDDLVSGVRWTSTLDGRTTPICRARDGDVYPVDAGPRPPAHWNCRSTAVPILKSWRAMGVDSADADGETRASLDGQVPAETTYQRWLAGRSAAFQDDVLGPTRGRLFRAGGLELNQFVDGTGRQYTLEQLRARNPTAFERARV